MPENHQSPNIPDTRRTVFSRMTRGQYENLGEALRTETVGGFLLIFGAVAALIWANTPASGGYHALMDVHLGPEALHLDLSIAHWAADGLLAIFFFIAGLELKREMIVGELRDPKKAALPIVAAVCGVAVPALFFLVISLGDPEAMRGWAIPAATDIAFALAVLAVIGSHLPRAVRAFLLTLAVVDDLIAITIIAVFYTSDLNLPFLGFAVVPLVLFGLLVRSRKAPFALKLLLVPLALLAWYCVYRSGIHATIAGVVLAFTIPVGLRPGEEESVSEAFLDRIQPISAGVVVPIFAFCAAGVTLVGGGLGGALSDRVFYAIIVGLVVGKLVGILGGTWLTVTVTKAKLDESVHWIDVAGIALLGGIGFTVSLLVGELSFGAASARDSHVKFGVLVASFLAALLGAAVLSRRNRYYRDDAPVDDDAETA